MTIDADTRLKDILARTRTIALVGFSNKPDRASYKVAEYLAKHGYRVIPVNPGLAGQSFMGEEIAASLADISPDAHVDMVDIFRRADQVPPIVDAAIASLPDLKTVWVQLGISSPEAQAIARDSGLDYVEDRCTKMEHERLMG